MKTDTRKLAFKDQNEQDKETRKKIRENQTAKILRRGRAMSRPQKTKEKCFNQIKDSTLLI